MRLTQFSALAILAYVAAVGAVPATNDNIAAGQHDEHKDVHHQRGWAFDNHRRTDDKKATQPKPEESLPPKPKRLHFGRSDKPAPPKPSGSDVKPPKDDSKQRRGDDKEDKPAPPKPSDDAKPPKDDSKQRRGDDKEDKPAPPKPSGSDAPKPPKDDSKQRRGDDKEDKPAPPKPSDDAKPKRSWFF